MKKLCLMLSAAVVFLLPACRSTEQPASPGGAISMEIVRQDPVTEQMTKSEDFQSEMKVLMTSPSGEETMMDWPAGGVIDGLEAGEYSLVITTYPNGMPESGFGNAYWYGESGAVAVSDGRTSDVTVECTQQNGGVCFEYSEELSTRVVVPTVTDADGTSVIFDDGTAETAYFVPGDAVLEITIDGLPAVINGESSCVFEVKAGHDWRISIKQAVAPDGGLSLDVEFEDVAVEDTEIGVKNGFIRLTQVVQASYYGREEFGKFVMTMRNECTADDPDIYDYLRIEGYTSPKPYAGFKLDEGYYDIEMDGTEPYTLMYTYGDPLGLSYLGTYGATFDELGGLLSYVTTAGRMSVSYEGDNISLEIIMRGYMSGMGQVVDFEGRKYVYEGPVEWLNYSQQDPPAEAAEWDSVPESGSFTMSGEDNLFGYAPSMIAGTFEKQESPVKRLVLTGWGGKDGTVVDYSMYLVFDEEVGAFYVDQDVLVGGEGSMEACYWAIATERKTRLDDDYIAWVPFDASANTLDLTYPSYGGMKLFLGVYDEGFLAGSSGDSATDFIRGVIYLSE